MDEKKQRCRECDGVGAEPSGLRCSACDGTGIEATPSTDSKEDEKEYLEILETKAAIYLEEAHVSGDTMVKMNYHVDELSEDQTGSYYVCDLMARFLKKELESASIKVSWRKIEDKIRYILFEKYGSIDGFKSIMKFLKTESKLFSPNEAGERR